MHPFWRTPHSVLGHGPLALDALLVPKISKRHFFQDIQNSFHGVTWMGLKPHQNFFQNFFSTNMVARGVQSFSILEGATDPLIEQWQKFSCQFSPDMWWKNAENFKSISRPIQVTPWKEFSISWKKWRFEIFGTSKASRASGPWSSLHILLII